MSYVHRAKKLARERGYILEDQTDSRCISVLVNMPEGYSMKGSNANAVFAGGERGPGRTKDHMWRQVIQIINWGVQSIEERRLTLQTDTTDYFHRDFRFIPFPKLTDKQVKDRLPA